MKKKKSEPIELQAKNAAPKTTRHGPEAERLKINAPFEDAIKAALRVKRPKGGWPK